MSVATADRQEVVNFGCRLNIAEGEAIRSAVKAAGGHDTVVFNSCAVTDEAVRQARQAVRRALRERPGTEVVVTGCAAELERDAFAAMGARVVANDAVLQRNVEVVTDEDATILEIQIANGLFHGDGGP